MEGITNVLKITFNVATGEPSILGSARHISWIIARLPFSLPEDTVLVFPVDSTAPHTWMGVNISNPEYDHECMRNKTMGHVTVRVHISELDAPPP
jgi:hypothetical protein